MAVATPRNNARCTVQRKSNRVKSVISLPETSSERGEEFKRKGRRGRQSKSETDEVWMEGEDMMM